MQYALEWFFIGSSGLSQVDPLFSHYLFGEIGANSKFDYNGGMWMTWEDFH